MATYYVDSNATGANDGSSWADAFVSLKATAASLAAGDTVYVASDHSETVSSGDAIFSGPGTIGSPCHILSADKTSGAPPTALQSGAYFAGSTSYIDVILYGSAYYFGITFSCPQLANIILAGSNDSVHYEQCLFDLRVNHTTPKVTITDDGAVVRCLDCSFKFANASQGIRVTGASSLFIRNGEIASGSVTPNALVDNSPDIIIDGFDMSNLGASFSLLAGGALTAAGRQWFRNCKLPSGWSGSLFASTPTEPSVAAAMFNCDDGDTNFRISFGSAFGQLDDETTIIRSGGASDGATNLAWRISTFASTNAWSGPFYTPEVAIWNETVGSSVTVTVHVVHDAQGSGTSSDLTDKEAWLEVMGLDTSGVPLGGWYSDRAADYLDAAADQTDDSATTWTTTGLTTPVKQKFSVTFTPQEKGYIIARVCVAKPSTTVYVCPKIELS